MAWGSKRKGTKYSSMAAAIETEERRVSSLQKIQALLLSDELMKNVFIDGAYTSESQRHVCQVHWYEHLKRWWIYPGALQGIMISVPIDDVHRIIYYCSYLASEERRTTSLKKFKKWLWQYIEKRSREAL